MRIAGAESSGMKNYESNSIAALHDSGNCLLIDRLIVNNRPIRSKGMAICFLI